MKIMSHKNFHTSLFLIAFFYFMMCPASHNILHELMGNESFSIINSCEIKAISQEEINNWLIKDFTTNVNALQETDVTLLFENISQNKSLHAFFPPIVSIITTSRLLL